MICIFLSPGEKEIFLRHSIFSLVRGYFSKDENLFFDWC